MKADVIVLTKGTNGLVNLALQRLVRFCGRSLGKLVVCWTGEDGPELEALKQTLAWLGVEYVLAYGEYNFAKLNNRMAKEHVSSEFVLFMNDDVLVESDALGACLESLKADEKLAAVGMKLLHLDGTIQHAGVFIDVNEKSQTVGHILYGKPDMEVPVWLVDALTGAFLLVRTELFWKAGGFDEQFKCCFEDVVLCWRLRKLGYGLLCRNDLRAVHLESMTRMKAMCNEDVELMWKILLEKEMHEEEA